MEERRFPDEILSNTHTPSGRLLVASKIVPGPRFRSSFVSLDDVIGPACKYKADNVARI